VAIWDIDNGYFGPLFPKLSEEREGMVSMLSESVISDSFGELASLLFLYRDNPEPSYEIVDAAIDLWELDVIAEPFKYSNPMFGLQQGVDYFSSDAAGVIRKLETLSGQLEVALQQIETMIRAEQQPP
jgi:hypothetical protein